MLRSDRRQPGGNIRMRSLSDREQAGMSMIRLEDMDTQELLAVIRMKDAQIKELKSELNAWQQLVEELQQKLGLSETQYTGSGD